MLCDVFEAELFTVVESSSYTCVPQAPPRGLEKAWRSAVGQPLLFVTRSLASHGCAPPVPPTFQRGKRVERFVARTQLLTPFSLPQLVEEDDIGG